MERAHIFYSGIVQGVGFRYTVHSFASQLRLLGWVKNLPDGRVEILVEGDKESIEQLCQSLDRHFEGSIRDKQVNIKPSSGEFKDFRIAF